jgi:hypothetical protein
MIRADRLDLSRFTLSAGNHTSLEQGACVMELASYVAGAPWSDHPPCTSPVITSFLIAWNDSLPSNAERDRLLKPLIPEVIDTKSTPAVEERRSYLALDWLIRVHTPKWLDLVPALQVHATALRDLDEIVNLAGATAAGKLTAAAWAAAWAAARAAAGAAAGAAARDAARDAAGAAAGAAAWAAAGAAAGEFLRPTTAWLQQSALDLVGRMVRA